MATDLRTFLFIGVSAVALLLITGCNNKFSDPQTLVAEAKQYQQKGDNNAAIIQLKNALQKDPDIAEARYMLGALYVDAGDPTSGEKELRKALELGFDTTKVIPALARSLLMQERYQQVLDETREDQRSAPLLATRGYAELALGGLSGAANSFDQALKLEPEFPEALLGQARLALAARKMDKASQLVDHVLAMAPKNTDAWLLRGDLYDLQGNNERAAAAYGEAVQIRPDNISAHIRRASVLTSLNNFDAAQAEINAARKVARGDPIVDYGQALLLFRTGKSGPALEAIQRVLRVAPDHLPSVVLAGLLQYSRGSPEQAERNMRRFLDHSPNSIYARKLLAFIQIKSNQNERALQTLQPALKQAPQDA